MPTPDGPDPTAAAVRLARVRGVVGVVLGVYYRGDLDVPALRTLAAELDPAATVSERGGWGPWVDGGAWLTVAGAQVDWIYRDLDRVEAVWADCRAGRVGWHGQNGHPHGFWSPAYVGELATAVVLADPAGELAALRAGIDYPDALRAALWRVALWEAGFCLDVAVKPAGRGDVAHVAGCLYRSVGCLVQAVHAHARRWITNEKGGVRSAASLSAAPRDFEARVAGLLGALGRTPAELAAAVGTARELVAETGQNGGQGTAGHSPDGSG